MSLVVRAGGREGTLRIEEHDGDRLVVELDGRRLEGSARKTADGAWSLILEGRSYEVWVEECSTAYDACRVALEGRVLEVEMEDPRSWRPETEAAALHDGWAEVRVPMPGRVVSVLVEEGAEVEAGQGLVVVEAMKMENELTSPKAGRVVQISVEEGQAVEAGVVAAAVE